MSDQHEANNSPHVLIFYSSTTEPRLLDLYRDSLIYLEESSVETEIIDVAEDRERAQENDVIATPTVIVRSDDTEERHIGILNGLKNVLENDLYGRAILHKLGFKEGRRFAQDHGLEDAEQDDIESALQHHLEEKAAVTVQLSKFDKEKNIAEGLMKFEFDEDGTSAWHGKMEEFLGGVFTEVFGTGVMGVETECGKEGHEHCTFIVKTEHSE